MTTHVYYLIVDLSKENYDYHKYWFSETYTGNDIFQSGLDFARQNGSKPEDLRLYVFQNKTEWENNRQQALKMLRDAEQEQKENK